MKKHLAWLVDLETAEEILVLGKQHGKKTGDNIQVEFEEIRKQKPDKFKLIGATDQDIDMITGNLREAGKKVINLNEIDRRKNDNIS